MLILMGAIGEAATGYVISGTPELTPELADALIDTIFDGWTLVEVGMKMSRIMRVARPFIPFSFSLPAAGVGAAAVAGRGRGAGACRQSAGQAEPGAGGVTSKAASPKRAPMRCPTFPGTRIAMRSRDPGLLNSPNFDNFPPEFRIALSPLPANAFATSADLRQTLFSFKLGKALEAARLARTAGEQEVQRARQTTALDAVRVVQPAAVHHRAAARGSRQRGLRSRAIWTLREPARGRRGDRARGAARRSRPRESAGGAAAGGKRSGVGARHAEHRDAAADEHADRADRRAGRRAVRRARSTRP